MRYIIAAAALAASVSFVNAEPTYVPGGPVQNSGLCQVSTTGGDGYFGYLKPCEPKAAPAPRKKKS